ncbi:hypothetical protein F5Y16DRAFT_407365 [Xylariaceae sp. FL0255]|nr:hypothetical protein F5Y16DRAFT_407365 [Xylariaceae sp. FL0255]
MSITTPSFAKPVSYFPVNSQLPPVARVSEPFSFVFSPQTFFSAMNMTYSLADGAPAWLSLDGSSRRLSGTPDENSVPEGEGLTGVPIVLIAKDETGLTDANVTLVVSRSAGPNIQIPLLDQIQDFGPYSAPDSVLLYPSKEFEFAFQPNTFGVAATQQDNEAKHVDDIKRNGVKETMNDTRIAEPQFNYYAVSGNNAPLPSWVTFNPEKLAFSGTTPPFESLVQPPQTFEFQLIASDVVGFSAASIPFSIVVGTHELTSDQPVVELNATRGTDLEYTNLPNIVKINEKPLQTSDVASITAVDLPAWLSFDETSWAVSGTPDAAAKPVNVTIAIIDKFTDSLNVTLAINMDTEIFMSDLPALNVSAGHDFSFDLKKYLYDPKDTTVNIETTPTSSWVQFDASSQVLSGSVPTAFPDGFSSGIEVTFNAEETGNGDKETKSLNIHVSYPPNNPRQPQPSPSPSETPKPVVKGDGSHNNLLWLLVLLLLIVPFIIFLFFFWRKRRQRSRKLTFADIGGPEPGSLVVMNSSGDGSLQDMRKMLDIGSPSASVRSGGYKPAGMSNLRTTQTRSNSNPSVESGTAIPHALMHSGAVKIARKDSDLIKSKASWFGGQKNKPSPGATDEVSLLSDTSIGEGETHIATEDLTSHTSCSTAYDKRVKKPTLDVPISTEPFSIQPTPEMAYTAMGRYDYVSDDEMPPPVGYSAPRRSGTPQQAGGLGIRGVQQRLSRAWKRGSAAKLTDDLKRQSNLSNASDVTTRTSILTSGFAEEATATSTNVVAKPTVIHIPSRPGEVRQVSRRTQDSTTFFSGRSLTKSQRNFGLSNSPSVSPKTRVPIPPPTSLRDPDAAGRDSDTSWDMLARNSLGIAYKDLVRAEDRPKGENWKGKGPSTENWRLHATTTTTSSQDLMSPDQWPIPSSFADLELTTSSDVLRSRSEPPAARPAPLKTPTSVRMEQSPVTPKGKGKAIGIAVSSHSQSSGSGSASSRSQHSSTRSVIRRTSEEDRLRMSRIREEQALAEFKAMISKTPSPNDDNDRAMGHPRMLPETPTRVSRGGEDAGDGGLKSAVSKRSVRTMQSTRSTRSGWTGSAGEEEDEDAWEDVRPAESTVGVWDDARSDGSFSVYI